MNKCSFGYTKKQKQMIEKDIEKEESITIKFMQEKYSLVNIAKKGELKRRE